MKHKLVSWNLNDFHRDYYINLIHLTPTRFNSIQHALTCVHGNLRNIIINFVIMTDGIPVPSRAFPRPVPSLCPALNRGHTLSREAWAHVLCITVNANKRVALFHYPRFLFRPFLHVGGHPPSTTHHQRTDGALSIRSFVNTKSFAYLHTLLTV